MVKKRKKNTTRQKRKSGIYNALLAVVRLLFKPIAIKVYLLLLVLMASYVIYLDATIRSSFEGKKWQLPARVYARPLEIFAGLKLSADELESELKELGYFQRNATSPGTYFRKQNKITLYTRGYQFWDGSEPAYQAQITLTNRGVSSIRHLNNEPIALLRLEPIEIGAIYPRHREDRVLVKVEDVPPLLTAALLAVEDHRFYKHYGLSPAAITRAALQNIKSGGVVQGGSTITQQLVKNYYLNHRRTLRRKLTEAVMSILLEIHYDKEQILQAYLNEVYLGQAGDRAVHGFGLASQHYFNRPLSELSVEKLALLIAIVRGPTYYDPWRNSERAKSRRNLVLDVLVSHQLLTASDATWAKEQPLNLGKKSRSHFVFPAYMDIVKRQLQQVYNEKDLTSNGMKIYTSFNPRIQRHAEKAVTNWLAAMGDKELQAAIIVTHPSTGEVLAIVGGRQPRFSGFNRALDARRSIGSVVKPFVYLSALQSPDIYTLVTLIDDSPITIITDANEEWRPRNFDRESHGEVPLITAMAKSYNQATARLGQSLGADVVAQTLQSSGLERKVNPVPSLFIGTTQLTPLEVAGLYQGIAANGYQVPLKAIRSVLDNNNEPLEHFPFNVKQVMDSETNFLIQHALIEVGRLGSARYAYNKLGDTLAFAGKTGTSGQQRDSWFAGYTGDILAVVWLGYDANKPTAFTGSSGALRIWTNLIAATSKEGLSLVQPNSVEFQWVDLLTGRPSTRGCKSARKMPFIVNSEPRGSRTCGRSKP